MTTTHTPAPARSDVDRSAMPLATGTRPFRKHGLVLAAGAVSWAVAIAALGTDPSHQQPDLILYGIASGAFQVGLLCLLRALWRTQGLGTGRLARFALRLEAALVSLAIASTAVDAIGVSDLDQAGWLLLDMFWPLSMMGMFFIGVRIAIAGRWKGLTRFWPLVAESWAVVTIPTYNVFGEDAAQVVGSLHLLVGYTVLGLLVSRKEN